MYPFKGALNWGIYKTELSETEPTNVMFVDVGHASTSVGIVEFYKGKLKVIATAYERNVGGRNFDHLIANYFANEFKVCWL
jgi:heat shock protein 4